MLLLIPAVNLGSANATSARLRLTGDYDVVVGKWARFTVQRFDPLGTKVTNGSLSVDLNSTSTSRTKRFSEVPGGYSVSSIVIPDGSDGVEFFYYDTLGQVCTITVSARGFMEDNKKLYIKRDVLDHFDVVVSKTTVQAGEALDIAVTAQDTFDNIINDYVGRIHFASNSRSSPTGAMPMLPSDYKFLLSDEGRKLWKGRVIFFAAQRNVFLNVSDVANPGVTGSTEAIDVLPGLAANMECVRIPQPERVGRPIQFIVKITDLYGNPVQGHPVLWCQRASPEKGPLSGLPRTVETDGRGLSYLAVVLGNVPGDYSFIASANTTQGRELLGSPICFDARATSDPDFSVSLPEGEERWVQVGESISVRIQVSSWGGYNSTVTLKVSNPGFLKTSLSRDNGQPTFSSDLNIIVGSFAEQGDWNLTILATGSDGKIPKEARLRLRIAHPTSYYALFTVIGFTFAILSLIPKKLGVPKAWDMVQKVWGMALSIIGFLGTSAYFSNLAYSLMTIFLWIAYILTMFSIYVLPDLVKTLVSKATASRRHDKKQT